MYSGHCACRNDSKVGGAVCWGNFGVNQQNGGRVWATQATVFKAGPYAKAFDDFRDMVVDLEAAAAQLRRRDYARPLLGNVSGGRGLLRTPIKTTALRQMCMTMHHFAPGTKLDRDGWGDDICRYAKSVTFGLRTGPKNALLGFAIGQLGLHVRRASTASFLGHHFWDRFSHGFVRYSTPTRAIRCALLHDHALSGADPCLISDVGS